MNPELIVMLTHNDRTVENALELFGEMKDSPIRHWGFKDVGLPKEKIKELVHSMTNAGKTTCLEVVSLSEEEGLEAAKLAVASGVDILMGTVFFDSINDYLRDKAIEYYPFLGNVHSHPTVLEGSVAEIVDHAQQLESRGVDGVDLLTFRYLGEAADLLAAVVEATSVPVVCAGGMGLLNVLAKWSIPRHGDSRSAPHFLRRGSCQMVSLSGKCDKCMGLDAGRDRLE